MALFWEEQKPDPGTLEYIFDFLGYLDRPRNAVATAVRNITDEDPDTGFLRGLLEGATAQKHTSWGDVFGIPEAKPEEDWAPWLAKGGARLATDVVLDPLNLLFGSGAITKGLGLATKGGSLAYRTAKPILQPATDLLAASGFGKAFMHGVPFRPEFNQAVDKVLYGDRAAAAEANKAYAALQDTLAKHGMTEEHLPGIREAIERGPKFAGSTNLPPEVLEAYRPLQDVDRRLFDEYNQYMEMLQKPQRGPVEMPGGGAYVPRVATRAGEKQLESMFPVQPAGVRFDPNELSSRELFRIAERGSGGELLDLAEKPIVTKIKKPYLEQLGITEGERGELFFKGRPVEKVQATLADIERSGVMKPESFITDPGLSFMSSIGSKQGKVNFLRMMADMGRVVDENQVPKWLVDLRKAGQAPEGWRQLRIPGLTEFAAPHWAANQFENAAQIFWDPKTTLGGIEKAMRAITDSPVGQLLKRYNTIWKGTVLGGHPGYIAGNAASNQVLTYLAGTNPLTFHRGIALQRGVEKEILPGLTYKTLHEEVLRRGGFGVSWGETERALRQAEQAARGKGSFLEKLGAPGRGVQWTGEKIAAFQDAGFKLSGMIEDNAHATVIADYLLKHARSAADVTPELIDRAVSHANDFIFDFSRLAPLERELRNFVPFMSWHRNMIARTLKDLGLQPHRMANVGRFWDFTFRPMTAADEEVAPDWIKGQAPAFGIGKWLPQTSEGHPRMFLTGRFNPYGNIEQMIKQPQNYLQSLLSPMVKTPIELAMNANWFKNRPIDPVAASGLEAMLNPATGRGPYGYARDKVMGTNWPAAYEHILNAIPGNRYRNEIETLLAGDVLPSNKPSMTPREKALWYGTGGKAFDWERERMELAKQLQKGKSEAAIKKEMRYAQRKNDAAMAAFYQRQLNMVRGYEPEEEEE